MDHRRTLSGVAAMLVAATGSHADSANITVYSNGFGLVSETRQMVFEKGVQVVPFDGVSQYIEPSSVLFDGSGLALLEQNYVYDLVNGDALLKRFLDKEISVSLKEGGERYVELYLVLADPDFAGPGVRHLAAILRETVQRECARTRGEQMGLNRA